MSRHLIAILSIGLLALRPPAAVAGEVPPLGHPQRLPSSAAPLFWGGDGTNRYTGATPPLTWIADLSTAAGGAPPPATGIRWRVELPTPLWVAIKDAKKKSFERVPLDGTAQPLAFGDRLYVTAAPTTLLALSMKDGAVIWRHDLDPQASIMDEASRILLTPALKAWQDDCRGEAPPDPTPYEKTLSGLGLNVLPSWRYNGLMPWTPATDGERVAVTSGLGVLAVLSAKDGTRLWQHAGLGVVRSPILAGDRVIVCADAGKLQEGVAPWGGGAMVLAFALADGRLLWARPWNGYKYHGGGSPLTITLGGKPAVVVADGQVLDVADGTVITELGASCGLGSSPTALAGRLYMPHGDYHTKPAKVLVADLTKGLVAAAVESPDPTVAPAGQPAKPAVPTLRLVDMPGSEHARGASLLVADDLVFVPSLKMTYWFAVGAADSKPAPLLAGKEGIPCASGIVLGGSHLFAFDDKGSCLVFAIKDGKPVLFGRNPGPAPVAPPAFLGDRILLRTAGALVCIGPR